jgi:hypothetical protein
MRRVNLKPILSILLYAEHKLVCIQTFTSDAIASSGFMERVNTEKGGANSECTDAVPPI